MYWKNQSLSGHFKAATEGVGRSEKRRNFDNFCAKDDAVSPRRKIAFLASKWRQAKIFRNVFGFEDPLQNERFFRRQIPDFFFRIRKKMTTLFEEWILS